MPQARRPLSICLIDADPSGRSAIARLLLAHGYASSSFATFADYDAHRALAGKPDLVLVDTKIWVALSAEARKQSLGASIVIALGDEARLEQVGPSFAAGCFDYLVKPVPPSQLADVLARAADQHERLEK